MEKETKFTHIAVVQATKRKVSILATLMGRDMYEVVGSLVEREWKEAKKVGMVKDTMLQPEQKGD